MKKRKKSKRGTQRILTMAIVITTAIACFGYYFLYTSMSRNGEQQYVCIDEDDNIDSVYAKIRPKVTQHSMWAFKKLATWKNYANHIKTGRYEIGNEGALQTFRHMRNGIQAPVNLTIRSVRTPKNLAHDIAKRLMIKESDLLNVLEDDNVCKEYGYTPKTIIAMFIPNTYDVYWNISIHGLLDRMEKENKRFWTMERKEKAKALGLSEVEVVTLASIVDEETANEGEMPMIAGMYINRLNKGMLLQADPTVKYANGNFAARRIYNSMLRIDNPYNTYKYKGLPPGPIRIPSLQSIEAVLNHVHHDYLYMCAKEDFSGTHNFARTYAEHQVNAAKYSKALNERGIR